MFSAGKKETGLSQEPGRVALLPEKPRADLAETIALRRFDNAADVADLVAFLLSDDASGITGRVLEVPSTTVL